MHLEDTIFASGWQPTSCVTTLPSFSRWLLRLSPRVWQASSSPPHASPLNLRARSCTSSPQVQLDVVRSRMLQLLQPTLPATAAVLPTPTSSPSPSQPNRQRQNRGRLCLPVEFLPPSVLCCSSFFSLFSCPSVAFISLLHQSRHNRLVSRPTPRRFIIATPHRHDLSAIQKKHAWLSSNWFGLPTVVNSLVPIGVGCANSALAGTLTTLFASPLGSSLPCLPALSLDPTAPALKPHYASSRAT